MEVSVEILEKENERLCKAKLLSEKIVNSLR
jgi:hypothetical protein